MQRPAYSGPSQPAGAGINASAIPPSPESLGIRALPPVQ
jgi:hypothetical protein